MSDWLLWLLGLILPRVKLFPRKSDFFSIVWLILSVICLPIFWLFLNSLTCFPNVSTVWLFNAHVKLPRAWAVWFRVEISYNHDNTTVASNSHFFSPKVWLFPQNTDCFHAFQTFPIVWDFQFSREGAGWNKQKLRQSDFSCQNLTSEVWNFHCSLTFFSVVWLF